MNCYSILRYFFCSKTRSDIHPIEKMDDIAPSPKINTTKLEAYNPEELQHFLNAKGLTASDLYTPEISRTLRTLTLLSSIDPVEIIAAFTAFNQAFNEITLSSTSIVADSIASNTHFLAVDEALIEELQTKISSSSCFSANLLSAFICVYNRMNACRQQYQLIYHQPRHAAEVFSDLHQLLMSAGDDYAPMHLVTVLAGLFHDCEFSHTRIQDENASTDALLEFLQPVLKHLSSAQRMILRQIFYLFIVGGTLPCFTHKNARQQIHPQILSLAELSLQFLQRIKNPLAMQNAMPSLIHLTRLLSAVDIQRTSLPTLHKNIMAFDSPAWQILAPFLENITAEDYLPEQLKLSQGLRVLTELSANPASPLYPFALDVAAHQGTVAPIDTWWEESMLLALTKKLADGDFSEIQFSQRMSNSCDNYPLELACGTFKNTWPQHSVVLAKLHAYLNDDTIALDQKRLIISALACVTADQTGKYLTIEIISTMAEQIQWVSIAMTQSLSKSI